MKKYRVKINEEKILGPLSESDVRNLIESKKINQTSLVQYFPDEEWKELSTYNEFGSDDATFIRTLDSINFEVEQTEAKEKEAFPEEFKFEKKELKPDPVKKEIKEVEEKTIINTIVKKQSNELEDDKTKVTLDTKRYLEELKKEKIKEEQKKQEEEKSKEPEVDLNNDSTQMIDLSSLKKELEDELVETELSLEKEKKEDEKRKKEIANSKKSKEKNENTKFEEKEKTKKNKKLIYIIFALIGVFLLFDEEDEKITKTKKIEIVNPVIKFPQQFEVEDKQKAKEYLSKGLTLLEEPTYINKIKAAKYFKLSTEHQFRENVAISYLIRTYSELLVNSNTPIEDSAKIFKLVQINKAKALSNPKYAESIASFYLYAGKPLAAQKTIEKFNAIKKNKPTIELFALYLDTLRINDDIKKANNVAKKLEKQQQKNYRVSLALVNYYNFIGETEKYHSFLTETYKKNKYSVNLILKSIKILIDENKFEVIPKVMRKVNELEAERSKVYYSKYLEYQGILKAYNQDYEKANKYFKEALHYNESSELRSRLASLELSGDPISDVLISESKAISLINRSKKNIKNKNIKIAFKDALEATRIAENYIPAKVHLAELQINNGLYSEAIDSLESLQKRNVTDPEVTFTLIDAYTESYKFSDVKKLLSIISTSNLVNDYRYYTATAKYYVYKGDFYNSINWLQLAIRKNPLDENMNYELVKILSRYKKYQKAKVFLSKLIDLNPVELKYRVAYSNILYEAEGITYAVGYLYDILQDYPNNSQLLSAIGIYYYKSGQQKKYEQVKIELEKLPTKDSALYKFLIDSAILDNDIELLIANLKKLLEIEPGNLEKRILLGKTYLNEERYKEALIEFKKVKTRLKSYPRLQYFMSKLYLLTDNNEKAIELAKAEVKANPQNLDGYVLLGDIYSKEKKYNDAEGMYKKAQKIDDKDVDTLVGLSAINLKRSQFDIAIDLLIKARSVDPNNANIHKLLGDAYRKIGQGSLAIESYNIFLELSPNTRYKDEINTYLRLMQ